MLWWRMHVMMMMMMMVVVVMVMMMVKQIEATVVLIEPKECLAESQVTVFDISGMRCRSCGVNERPLRNGGTSCECNPSYRMISTSGGRQCIKCSDNQATSRDGFSCIKCAPENGYSNVLGNCACSLNNQIYVDAYNSAYPSGLRSCVSCPINSKVDFANDPFSCIPCSDANMIISNNTCVCPNTQIMSSGMCVSKVHISQLRLPTSNMDIIRYNSIKSSKSTEATTTFRSWTIGNMYLYASVECELMDNPEGCQALGNLCVLQDYLISTGVCGLYREYSNRNRIFNGINGVYEWPENMPWLYYSNNVTRDAIKEETLPKEYTFEKDEALNVGATSTIRFILARYDLYGKFLGYKDLEDELQLCKENYASMVSFLRFGTNHVAECRFKITSLLNIPVTEFYDLYVLDLDQQMYPVPIVNRNYREGSNGGILVNDNGEAVSAKQFTRRFFVYDVVSGVQNHGAEPAILRFAEDIHLDIRLQDSSTGRIRIPILSIQYSERTLLSVRDTSASGDITMPKVSFRVTYTMDLSTFKRDVKAAFIVLTLCAFFIWISRIVGWRRRNNSNAIDMRTIINALYFALMITSTIYFWMVWGISLYWLLFFKGQNTVHLLLPTEKDMYNFKVILIILFVSKTLEVLALITKQNNIDVFFVDWEKPRGVVSSSGKNDPDKLAPVSSWRTFFVANEWNEIQSYRKIKVAFTLFVVIFFMESTKLGNVAFESPESSFEDSYGSSPINMVLRFALSSSIFIGCALLQGLVAKHISGRFFENKIMEFIDLCSISNISVFIMGEPYFGWYIHGRSVHGRADTDMAEMNEQLIKETEDLVGKRGLLPNSDNQTFEMHLPEHLRYEFDKIFHNLLADKSSRRVQESGRMGRVQTRNSGGASERSLEAYRCINEFLSSFIDHSLKETDYTVRDKHFFEKLLAGAPSIQQQGVFYTDYDDPSYDQALFSGHEPTLLLFDLICFSMFDMLLTNTVAAASITYMFDASIGWMRDYWGRKNIARKTLVDERFLI